MKAVDLTNQHFDEVFKELVIKKSNKKPFKVYPVISTREIAKMLWKKYHVPFIKEAEIVRSKLREWWNSYPKKHKPIFHKMICGIAVYLSSTMGADFAYIEKLGYKHYSLICIHQNQRRFRNEKNL